MTSRLFVTLNSIPIPKNTERPLKCKHQLPQCLSSSLAIFVALLLVAILCVANRGTRGQEVLPSSRHCSGCGILRYCSEKCQKSDRSHEQLCPQMAMLQRLVSVDFRSFSSHFSFASWADELHVKPKETTPEILEPPEEVSLEVPTPAPSERVPVAEDLCSLLDSVVDDELAEAIQRVEEALQESRLNYGHMFPLLF